MNRFVSAVSVAALAFAVAPAAFAKPITTVEHFKAGKHRHVTVRETVHTKTGVLDVRTTITKLTKAGVKETKTISEKEKPAGAGEYDYSKTVTGFDGKTRGPTTGTVSASGHASPSASAGGRSGSKSRG